MDRERNNNSEQDKVIAVQYGCCGWHPNKRNLWHKMFRSNSNLSEHLEGTEARRMIGRIYSMRLRREAHLQQETDH